mmetsp:Transcript_37552/g.79195  ORF Transcript_37552/g.79195 Transcript_37552/m.79195 type:complete len:365 (-) Transcript_37552:29-1123(-)
MFYHLNSQPDLTFRHQTNAPKNRRSSLQLVLASLGQRASTLLNNKPSRPMSGLHTRTNLLLSQKSRKESTHERISGTIGIHELFLRQRLDGVFLDLSIARHDRRRRSLREDHRTRPGAILLGRSGNFQCHLLQILAQAVLLSVRGGLALVAEEVIGIFQGRGDLVSEEIDDEGCREVEAEGLIVGEGVFCDDFQAVHGDGEEESGNVVHRGGFVNGFGFRSFEMGGFEVVGGREVGDEGTLASLDEDGACSRGGGFIFHVVDFDTIFGGAILELLAVSIGTDASHVGGFAGLSVGGHDPLSDADGVLGGTTGNVLGRVVVHKFFVDGDVLLLGEDGVVHFDIVFVEDVLADIGGDVEEGVTHSH